jgi:hypothetical protein
VIKHIKVNGVSYRVTVHADGTESYDPPLPSKIAEWFARGKSDMRAGHAPKLRTDSTFNAGRMSMRDQFQGDDAWLSKFDQEYRKQTGQGLPSNAVYMGQLAEKQFDASAVVKGQADVNKLIKRKQAKQQRDANTPPVRLAEDLVRSKMQQYRTEGDTSSASDLRHKVIEKHGRPV